MPAMRASVLPDRNSPLLIEQVTLDAPKAGEVLVKIAASGVCHVANMTAQISVPHLTLVLQEKAVLGCCYGSARPQVDMPRLLRLYKAGGSGSTRW